MMKPKESIFSIPVTLACEYTAAWRQMPHESPAYVKAFTIKIEELYNVLAELKRIPGANAVRAYIAEKPTEPSGVMETIILVGVEGFAPEKNIGGWDITEYPDPEDPEKMVSGCYDFNYPCPNTCAIDSPLLGM